MFAVERIIENILYSIKYDDSEIDEFENNEFEEEYERKNEFRRLFNNWSDPEYLEAFFEKHNSDLCKEFYNYISIENAINITIEESYNLENKILEVAKNGDKKGYENLTTLFKPLDDRENKLANIPHYQKSKVYGESRKSWIRIYAIRLETNVFIITGGAIKLTDKMDKEHLQKELVKLERVKCFLIEKGIIDNDSLVDFLELMI